MFTYMEDRTVCIRAVSFQLELPNMSAQARQGFPNWNTCEKAGFICVPAESGVHGTDIQSAARTQSTDSVATRKAAEAVRDRIQRASSAKRARKLK